MIKSIEESNLGLGMLLFLGNKKSRHAAVEIDAATTIAIKTY